MGRVVTYDDTRDCAIKIIGNLVEQGILEDDNNTYFQFQDAIQEEINEVLDLDIDDNFETQVFTKADLEVELFKLAEHYAMTSTKSEVDDFNKYIEETYNN